MCSGFRCNAVEYIVFHDVLKQYSQCIIKYSCWQTACNISFFYLHCGVCYDMEILLEPLTTVIVTVPSSRISLRALDNSHASLLLSSLVILYNLHPNDTHPQEIYFPQQNFQYHLQKLPVKCWCCGPNVVPMIKKKKNLNHPLSLLETTSVLNKKYCCFTTVCTVIK